MSEALTSEQMERYREEGYLLLEEVFEPSALRPLVEDLSGVVDGWAREYRRQGRLTDLFENEPFERRLSRMWKAMNGDCPEVLRDVHGKRKTPGMFHVITLPPILDIVESFVGSEILAHPQFNSRAKLPDGKSVVSWHQDIGFLTPDAEETFMANFWVPLVDANAENGCLEVIAGSHKCGILPFENGNPERIVPEALPRGEIVCCPVPAGGVLMIQHKTVHRSTPNFSDHVRWSLDIRYSDSRLPTGRASVPGFIARSAANPDSVAKNVEDWLKLFP